MSAHQYLTILLVTPICFIAPIFLFAWEDHPDKEHGFDADKTIPSSGDHRDCWRSDDSGKGDNRNDDHGQSDYQQGTISSSRDSKD